MNKVISFVYNCPNNLIEDTIIVETVDDDIIICKWDNNIRQWVDNSKPIDFSTISYTEHDIRFINGFTKWCYYSDFKKFLNKQSNLNIRHENETYY